MLAQKQAEEAIVSNFSEADGNDSKEEGNHNREDQDENQAIFSVKNILWHGGSTWDAWFSCASNQVTNHHPKKKKKKKKKKTQMNPTLSNTFLEPKMKIFLFIYLFIFIFCRLRKSF